MGKESDNKLLWVMAELAFGSEYPSLYSLGNIHKVIMSYSYLPWLPFAITKYHAYFINAEK